MPTEPEGLVRVRRALFSVSDPRGLAPFARSLAALTVELVATEGTRRRLAADGVLARPAEELTGIGNWFGGRLKTLHPGILGGILSPRTPAGDRELAERHLVPIDLVAVNFYPFENLVGPTTPPPDFAELIDIGGVTLARSAAKNFESVVVASDPEDYPGLQTELERHAGSVSVATRRTLAARAFARTERYDRIIGSTLAASVRSEPAPFPSTLEWLRSDLTLRYGENPHQKAAVYVPLASTTSPLIPSPLEVLQGGGLSYTNLLDLDTAIATVAEFPEPAAAVVKHATPSGVASAVTLQEAISQAVATDPVARYGCALAVNRPLDAGDLEPLHHIFVDLLSAPDVTPAARTAAARRAKLKLVRLPVPDLEAPAWEVKSAVGRLLMQETDRRRLRPEELRCVTARTATDADLDALAFAWRVVRHAKSNAIVLAHGHSTVGIGGGQPTRVKAVELAVEVAGPRAPGSVLASDAFFPFADGVEVAGRAGVRAILQPGGSLRDPEVIAAADRAGVAMYFTGWRVFRH
ncbi:MAG TPA: bifunctional phosphoribosylaminoimidazolecarboxamide formyltransferase/IMP cyclohydrolase [Thermoplasmata archaeon]|nr:bifunctional phosphoribosylaminoimidazolecarboxamide formyltransferase/IMP cyclohydrolase [Thermoplasmata archaeon]